MKKDLYVLITGNKYYGLCKAVCNLFDSVDNISYRTASRSNEWNLDRNSEQERLAEYFVKEGFDILATLPEWYQYLLYIAISASFGIKGVGQAAKMFKKK